MEFGLWNEAPKQGTAWGARAIFSDGNVELLWDRQSYRKGAFSKDAFIALLNKALPEACKAAKVMATGRLAGDRDVVVTLYADNGIIIKASTNASYGYLYMVAYEEIPTLSEAPEGLKWSGKSEIPKIGEALNSMAGKGTVLGYWEAHGWLGFKLNVEEPVDWFEQQGRKVAQLFGCDIR